MITIQTKVQVEQTIGVAIYNFMINPSDSAYQRWWPGVHLQLHNLTCTPSNVGNTVYMDEYIGERRLRAECIVTEAEPGRKITWQFKKILPLPVWLHLEFKDNQTGVTVIHTINAGFKRIGRILDILFQIYISESFVKAMEEHARIEFPKLGVLLDSVNSHSILNETNE